MVERNKIIQSFWFGTELSIMEQLCITSFLKNNHCFHLYTYDVIKNVPDGCIIKNANDIIPFDDLFFDSRGGVASFSDFFRMNLLYSKGGWWVDMDIVCLKPFDFIDDYCFSSEYFNGAKHVNIGCIKCPPQSELMNDYISIMRKRLKDNSIIEWGEFGPRLMKAILANYESDNFIKNPETFIMPPMSFVNNELIVSSFITELEPFCLKKQLLGYSIHLFNELWRLYSIDKNRCYSEHTIYGYLVKKFLF